MQAASALSGRSGLPRPVRARNCRVQAIVKRDQGTSKSAVSKPAQFATQLAQSAGVLAAALLLQSAPALADARDFELSAGEIKLEKKLEDTIKARGGNIPTAPEDSPGYEMLKFDRKGPTAKEVRDTQEIGKASPPPPKRNLAEAPAPELESPFRKWFGGLFNRPRSEAARTAATSPTPTGNSPVNIPSPGEVGEQAKQAAGSIAESVPSSESVKSQAKDAAGSVAESVPSSQSVQSQAKEAAGSIAESLPSSDSVQSQASQAATTVAESVPSPSSISSEPRDTGIASSSIQGIEAVTENSAKQGPDAVPDQPQAGTALTTPVQGSDPPTPGVPGEKPDESVTDSKGVPNDPLKVSTDSEMPNDPLNISSQSSVPVPQPKDVVADASMAAADTSNPLVAKLRGAVESVAPSAADTAKKAEPLKKGIEAGEKNLEQQSPLESTPLEGATKGETQAFVGKDQASE